MNGFKLILVTTTPQN